MLWARAFRAVPSMLLMPLMALKTYDEIAKAMNLSPRTVENEYALPMRKKLQLRSRIGLALFSWLSGIVRNNDEENVT